MLVHPAGPNYLRREVGVVDGVREGLRLQAHRAVLPVHPATLALDVVEPVAGIELHPGLVGPQLQRSTGRRVTEVRDLPEPVPVHGVVDVEPGHAGAGDVLDAGAQERRRAQVVRRAGDRGDLPRRDHGRVHGRILRREHLDEVAEGVAAAVAGEVPVRVVRQVHRRRLVQRRRVHPCSQLVRAAAQLVRHVHV